jgi:hypothetical protein
MAKLYLHNQMQNQGLLFIPDISGFSKFVGQTEIEHSKLIIQELLEILINANQIGLEVSEIEGDAILFYKFGEPPRFEELYKQVEEMFCAFHKSLITYEDHKYCQCTACKSVINLTLKVITHYGEFTGYQVKNFSKLIGKDVIVAHQLLKNDIEQHEYWLVTENLLQNHQPAGLTAWMKWNASVKQTENGTVAFQYTHIGELKKELSSRSLPPFNLAEKTKVISLTYEYDANIITLFHATGDYKYRNRWRVDIKRVEEVNHFLPRMGMKCKCIMENGEITTYGSSYHYQDDRIEFSETDDKNRSLYYTLEQTGRNKTKLTIDYYLPKNPLNTIWFKLTQKNKLENTLTQSMQNLTALVKEIKLPHVEQ